VAQERPSYIEVFTDVKGARSLFGPDARFTTFRHATEGHEVVRLDSPFRLPPEVGFDRAPRTLVDVCGRPGPCSA
jgi:hypothetical protein